MRVTMRPLGTVLTKCTAEPSFGFRIVRNNQLNQGVLVMRLPKTSPAGATGPTVRRFLYALLLAVGWLTAAVAAAASEQPARPVIEKVYPNPVRPGDTLYVEGQHFIEPDRMRSGSLIGAEDRRPRKGTFVEFTTRLGVKRVPAHLMPNPSR